MNRTITESRLTLLEGFQPNLWHITRIQGRDTAPLELEPRGALNFLQNVGVKEINGEPRIVVEEYAYSFFRDKDNEDSYVLRYEYSRTPDNEKPHSHIHVNGVHPIFPELDYKRLHIPVGRVSIEQVIAHLILEHGITAKNGKDAAIEILRESHRNFSRQRTDLENAPFP